MKFISSFRKNREFYYILLAVIFFGLIFAFKAIYHSTPEIKNEAKRFQGKIADAEIDLGKSFKEFYFHFDTIADSPFQNSVTWTTANIDHGDFFYFVFRNGKLIFWNNNEINIKDNIISDSIPEDQLTVLRLKNGWYGLEREKAGTYVFYGGFLIKREYPIQNEFISNLFSTRFDVPGNVIIIKERNNYPVFSAQNNFLFSIIIDQTTFIAKEKPAILLILFLVGTTFLFFFLYRIYLRISLLNERRGLLILSFTIDIIILRLIQFYFRFPNYMYQQDIFGPAWYASSAVMISLGDFLVNAFLLVLLTYMFFINRDLIKKEISKFTGKKLYIISVSGILLVVFSFQATTYFVADIVINSALALNLQNIAALKGMSGYGFFIICCLFLAFWFFSTGVLQILQPVSGQQKKLFIEGGTAIALNGLFYWIAGWTWNVISLLFVMVYLTFLFIVTVRRRPIFTFQYFLIFLCFFSAYATVVLNDANRKKERERRMLVAVKMASRRNPITEALYESVERKMLRDSVIRNIFMFALSPPDAEQERVSQYITSKYFTDYWNRFNVQITCCNANKTLQVQPQGYLVNCDEYFSDLIHNYGEATSYKNLFFLDYGFSDENYLIVLPGKNNHNSLRVATNLYIELSMKTAFKDPGYPELLLDKTQNNRADISEYAYALFQHDRLVHGVGAYNYRVDLKQYLESAKSWPFFLKDGMEHYYYRINNSTSLLISKNQITWVEYISPFSYLFILFSVCAFLTYAFVHYNRMGQLFSPKSLRDRLLITITGILVLTFIIIGIVLIMNIIKISQRKNDSNLQEKTFSVLAELQHKYYGIREWQPNSKAGLNDFLVKLSNVFFTDINFYDQPGDLIATSRPPVFEEGLLSLKINPQAYSLVMREKQSYFMHDETIGLLHYSSAYIPFFNNQNQLLGIVNLPCFSKQDELKKEISTVLVTFTNIYILLILFSVFIALLISNYIVSPLTLLAHTMSRLRLGRVNEKINWKQTDEIGQLVNEYNRMVDELSQSAQLLAQSERESAWREMARQVAHEIKNPLTPMKLNVQYLQKAWNENAPDWDQRLERFSKTLVEQIDTLSAIASGFSDFAQMPPENREHLDFSKLIPFVFSMYKDSSPIQFTFISKAENPFIYGDRKQLIRVFTNLINNAIQSITNPVCGQVRIQIENEADRLVLEISDNGTGIPEYKQERIFQPNFTTKSSGMGLGLSIVKGIIENLEGTIKFHSSEQEGTTFVINIPSDVTEKEDHQEK